MTLTKRDKEFFEFDRWEDESDRFYGLSHPYWFGRIRGLV